MTMSRLDHQQPLDTGRHFPPWVQAALTVAIAAAAFYLIFAHWVHVLDALPYLWVVLMMGMHLFMHGGHGGHGHGGHGGHDSAPDQGRGPNEGGAGHVH